MLEAQVHQVLQDVIDHIILQKIRSSSRRIPCNKMGSDHEILIPTVSFASYLVAKGLEEFSNLMMHHTFFPTKATVQNWLMFSVMTRGYQHYPTYQIFSNNYTPKVLLQGEADILTGSKRLTAFQKKLTLQRLF